jgi:hypothetical protein
MAMLTGFRCRPFPTVALICGLLLPAILPGPAPAQPGGRHSPGPGRGSPGPGGPGMGGPGMGAASPRGPGMGSPGLGAPGAGVPGAGAPGMNPPGGMPAGAPLGQPPRPPATTMPAQPGAQGRPPAVVGQPPFTPAWYAQHPDAWQHPKPYAEWRSTPAPPAAVINAFFGMGPQNPSLAAMTTAEWLPLGVFTGPPHPGSQATSFQQIAVSKAGQVKGVMFDAATNSVQPISGLCNPSSRQVTWSVGQAGGLGFETTLDALLEQAPPVSITSPAGTQPGTLVLVPAPPGQTP